MWYAAYLGADAEYGNRARLGRELDRLVELGIDNVRILGSSELSPLKNSITPAFRTQSEDYSETLLARPRLRARRDGRSAGFAPSST